jgi:hypothetical protein
MRIVLATFVAMAAACACWADTRPSASTDIQAILKEADLVVIVRPLTTTVSGKVEPDGFVAVETQFAVEGVVKGDEKSERVTVVHYQLGTDWAILSPFAGTLVSFAAVDASGVKTRYLLFLKKRGDGKFNFVNGDDPAFSQFRLRTMLEEQTQPADRTPQSKGEQNKPRDGADKKK